MICTFFGHHDCPLSIKPLLFETIERQIKQGATRFYVGNNGNFDALVLACLRKLKLKYNIHYAVVIAYLSYNQNDYMQAETIFPEGIELVPKKFAIDFRNRRMIDAADVVIAYVNNTWSRAARYVKKAKNKGAKIINLAND